VTAKIAPFSLAGPHMAGESVREDADPPAPPHEGRGDG
jgi:hypothetical protein